ncbi:hypothetical protein [Chryseobacterium flavum]|nr:hypothetical protein [Chryseobacterium flavum]
MKRNVLLRYKILKCRKRAERPVWVRHKEILRATADGNLLPVQ